MGRSELGWEMCSAVWSFPRVEALTIQIKEHLPWTEDKEKGNKEEQAKEQEYP